MALGDGEEGEARRPGRPARGSGGRTIEKSLAKIHETISTFFAMESLKLDAVKGKAFAEALAEVQKHYQLPAISDEKLALLWCAYCAGDIYLPMLRDVAVELKARRAASEKAAERPKPVTPPPHTRQVPIVQAASETAPVGGWFDPGAAVH